MTQDSIVGVEEDYEFTPYEMVNYTRNKIAQTPTFELYGLWTRIPKETLEIVFKMDDGDHVSRFIDAFVLRSNNGNEFYHSFCRDLKEFEKSGLPKDWRINLRHKMKEKKEFDKRIHHWSRRRRLNHFTKKEMEEHPTLLRDCVDFFSRYVSYRSDVEFSSLYMDVFQAVDLFDLEPHWLNYVVSHALDWSHGDICHVNRAISFVNRSRRFVYPYRQRMATFLYAEKVGPLHLTSH